jgi:hypothetical protein
MAGYGKKIAYGVIVVNRGIAVAVCSRYKSPEIVVNV